MDNDQVAFDHHRNLEAEQAYRRRLRRETMIYDGLLLALVIVLFTSLTMIGYMSALSLVKLALILPQLGDLPNALPRPHEWPWAFSIGVISTLGYIVLVLPSFNKGPYRHWDRIRGDLLKIVATFFIVFVIVASYYALKADGFGV